MAVRLISGSKVGEKKKRILEAKKKERRLGFTIVVGLIFMLVAGGWYVISSLPSSPGVGSNFPPLKPEGNPTLTTCIIEGVQVVLHTHTHVAIVIDGRQIEIPADIGIAPNCHRPVHTHSSDGIIHVESPYHYQYTLGDFFNVWGQPFGNDRLLKYTVDESHALTLFVNGERYVGDYAKIPLKDKQDMLIAYGIPIKLPPFQWPSGY